MENHYCNVQLALSCETAFWRFFFRSGSSSQNSLFSVWCNPPWPKEGPLSTTTTTLLPLSLTSTQPSQSPLSGKPCFVVWGLVWSLLLIVFSPSCVGHAAAAAAAAAACCCLLFAGDTPPRRANVTVTPSHYRNDFLPHYRNDLLSITVMNPSPLP